LPFLGRECWPFPCLVFLGLPTMKMSLLNDLAITLPLQATSQHISGVALRTIHALDG
jgi:hypothetical protein